MKFLSLIITVLISYNCALAQETKDKPPTAEKKAIEKKEEKTIEEDSSPQITETELELQPVESEKDSQKNLKMLDPQPDISESFSPLKPKKINILEEQKAKGFPLKLPKSQVNGGDKFHWKSAMVESLYFLGIQQSLRMVQLKTRREIKGPFFRDWGTSVKNLGKWRDGDSTFTNYVAHPMQGAVTGRIFINNSERSRKLEFGKSKEYWKSRAKTLAWSAVWSTQFELGPISEASIGNVGLYDRVGPNRMGWVDLVVTPTAGTAVVIGEDIIDKYILKNWMEKSRPRWKVRLLRMFITPFQAFTNVLHGQLPWKRYSRH